MQSPVQIPILYHIAYVSMRSTTSPVPTRFTAHTPGSLCTLTVQQATVQDAARQRLTPPAVAAPSLPSRTARSPRHAATSDDEHAVSTVTAEPLSPNT